MGNNITYLRKPITDGYFESGQGNTFVYAIATVQGWRKKQEDAFQGITQYYNNFNYFAVFDGHGGSEIAVFLKHRLHEEIKYYIDQHEDIELALHQGFLSCDLSLREPSTIQELDAIIEEENDPVGRILKSQASPDAAEQGGPSGEISKADEGKEMDIELFTDPPDYYTGAGPSEAYHTPHSPSPVGEPPEPDALQCLLKDQLLPSDSEDEDFNFEHEEHYSDDPISTDESSDDDVLESEFQYSATSLLQQKPGDYSGSTATVAILNKSKIYVANVGDTRCVLSRQGKAVELSVDHNPSNPTELLRIQNAGGKVTADGYINKLLNVSRAFGDFTLKGASQVPSEQCVSAEPHVTSIGIEKEDEFLVIASDGIWNCYSSQELVDFINVRLKNPSCALKEVCSDIISLSLAPDLKNDGSGCDNMTLIIIQLNLDEKSSSLLVEEDSMDVGDSDVLAESGSNKEKKETEKESISEQPPAE